MGAAGDGSVKPKLQTLGGRVARERREGGEVKLRTFIPLKIWKRGGSKIDLARVSRTPI
jgi:hypothetical protein